MKWRRWRMASGRSCNSDNREPGRKRLPPHTGHVSNFCGPTGAVIFHADPHCPSARVHPGHPVWTRLEFANSDGVTCFLQNRAHLKAAPLREICHIGHRRQMANIADKPLVWLEGEVKTPPFSNQARLEAGLLLRRLQQGQGLSLPHSRPMPAIGRQCHELRIGDRDQTWRIAYHVFSKKTQATPDLRAISDEEGA
jgi:phage-related protein